MFGNGKTINKCDMHHLKADIIVWLYCVKYGFLFFV